MKGYNVLCSMHRAITVSGIFSLDPVRFKTN